MPNSGTKSKQKSEEFSSLLFTVTSTAFPWDLYFLKLAQPLTVSTQAEFLDETQTKALRVFLLAIHSHIYSYFFKLTQPLTLSCSTLSRRKEENLKENHTPFPMEIHTETSSLGALKIMLRNLNEIVCSWILLLLFSSVSKILSQLRQHEKECTLLSYSYSSCNSCIFLVSSEIKFFWELNKIT
jgi:hypothetical protein